MNPPNDDLPWEDIAEALRKPVLPVPAVCRQAMKQLVEAAKVKTGSLDSEQVQSVRTDSTTISPIERPNMTACIHIERMMHRNSIAVTGESASSYALLKLIPTGLETARPNRMGLNLALALDVSGSMYEEDGTGISRLKRIQDAAIAAMKKLKPDDTMAIIGFAHNALVLLPPTQDCRKGEDRGHHSQDRHVRRRSRRHRHERRHAPGPGRARKAGRARQAVAGPGPHRRRNVRRTGMPQPWPSGPTKSKIHLTLMGVGLDWKAALIKDLAKISEGKWYYIDVNDKEEAERIFVEEFETLAAAGFMNVKLHLRPMKDVKIKRVRQVAPEIKELQRDRAGGTPSARTPWAPCRRTPRRRYIIDLGLPKRPDGKYVIAQMEITYDLGPGKRESTGEIPLEMTYTAAGHGYVNAEVMKHIDDIQLKEMSDNLRKALEGNDKDAARQLAEAMEKKGEVMGERAAKKTMIARKVLDELGTKEGVSKKTVLVMEDAARVGEIV